jgi:predicted DNA-binding ribbon-helix-helix protein
MHNENVRLRERSVRRKGNSRAHRLEKEKQTGLRC